MASERLIRRLSEHSLLEVRGEVAVGLGGSIKGHLSKATQDGGAAPGFRVAVTNTSSQQQRLGHGEQR